MPSLQQSATVSALSPHTLETGTVESHIKRRDLIIRHVGESVCVVLYRLRFSMTHQKPAPSTHIFTLLSHCTAVTVQAVHSDTGKADSSGKFFFIPSANSLAA